MMYNPLRPHIVEFGGGRAYAVRRFSLSMLGWVYFDAQRVHPDHYWWTNAGFAEKWFLVQTLDEARQLLAQTRKPKPAQVTKVYTK